MAFRWYVFSFLLSFFPLSFCPFSFLPLVSPFCILSVCVSPFFAFVFAFILTLLPVSQSKAPGPHNRCLCHRHGNSIFVDKGTETSLEAGPGGYWIPHSHCSVVM
ncbi:hypothetical protein ACRALDRAFT_1062682 [Sodiomyces alcalophilus JCM 7366]|uniref:uncharacterized protein n=1 Tax=Sodiomyces alcalophilus JCM 7366 TaxID=591952 RepID=UPI0039B6327E